MSSMRLSGGAARIVMLGLLIGIVGFIGVVFALHTADEARQSRERAIYAGTWVREGSNGDDYIRLDADGTYSVHVSVYTGSIEDERWTVDEGRIFIPTRVDLTVGGPSSGDETVSGWYLDIRGDDLVLSDRGTASGTYRRQ